MKTKKMCWSLPPILCLTFCLISPMPVMADQESVQWLNHLSFLPGDPSVITSFNAINSGVGGGLSGLVVTSTTPGETAQDGGNKVVEQGIQAPPGFLVNGVRVCYELTNANSYISQVRISQLQNPPSQAIVQLDDGTDLTDPGPVCVNSALPFEGTINPSQGALRLSLRVNFSDINDRIVIRGIGLHLVPDPDAPLFKAIHKIIWLEHELEELEAAFKNHTHTYLTGQGVGHNNTVAVTGQTNYVAPGPIQPPPVVTPPVVTPPVVTPPVVTPPVVTPPNKKGKSK